MVFWWFHGSHGSKIDSENFKTTWKTYRTSYAKKHWNIIKIVIQNWCKNHEKTIKKSIQKKGRKTEVRARNPGKPRAPVRVTIGLQKDNKRKTTWRRGIQRGDKPRNFDTPRAPSGPERIYLSSASLGFPGKPGGHAGKCTQDLWPSHPCSRFQA